MCGAITACRASSCAPRASSPRTTIATTPRAAFDDLNLKVNELLYRRVDLAARSTPIFSPWIAPRRSASAATSSARRLRSGPTTSPSCVATRRPWCARRYPQLRRHLRRRGWTMLPSIDRVYVNAHARDELGWSPPTTSAALHPSGRGPGPTQPAGHHGRSKGYHAQPTGSTPPGLAARLIRAAGGGVGGARIPGARRVGPGGAGIRNAELDRAELAQEVVAQLGVAVSGRGGEVAEQTARIAARA